MKTFFFLLFITSLSFAQKGFTSHEITDRKNFQGKIVRIDSFPTKYIAPRTVDIWLPTSYSKSNKYSVLYMHDGQMLFDGTSAWNKQEWKVDEVVSKLSAENKIEDIIVVAIWSISNLRHTDLYPKKPFALLTAQQQEKAKKEAATLKIDLTLKSINSDNYLKFIVKELKPYIDKNFYVHSDANHTAIMGSSMGGLISMYAICEYPKIFGKASCLSTHWIGLREFENNPIPESLFLYMKKKLPSSKNHKIYFDYGTDTLDALYLPFEHRVDEILQAKGYTAKDYKNIKFEGESHSEASWQKRIDIPLLFMFGRE